MRDYVKSWLTGVGRSDLARKADRDELPELLTQEAKDEFARFQRKETSPNDFLREILGIGQAEPRDEAAEASKPLGR
jgi:hypothetical protein